MNSLNEQNLIEQMLSLLNDKDYSLNENYKSALQVKEFIDQIPGGFFIYKADESEEIIYANRALLRIFRCNTMDEFKELTGNSFKGVVYFEDLEEVEKSIEEQISDSTDDLDYVEYRIMCKDGVIRSVEDYGHFVRTQNAGNFYYVFITDCTEKINRRNLERAALINEKQEKENKLKNLIEEYDKERKLINQEHLQRLEVIEGLSADYDSILYVDLDADKVLPYRLSSRLNMQFDRKLQLKEYSKVILNYADTWVYPEDRETFLKSTSPENIRKKLKDNQSFYFNFRYSQNGVKYIQLRFVDVGNSAHVSQIVMGFRSIDEEILQEMNQKRLLQEALNTAKLASVAKNTFLSNMSHDMRTPLNAIFGFTALAKKNASDGNAVIKYLDEINKAGKQMLDLIDKVLEISYIESQDFHINENVVNVIDSACEVYESLRTQAEEKNIRISLRCDTVRHSEVYADNEKLRQALYQIAANAVKYTQKGGIIRLTVDEQKSALNDYAVYRFIMEDTGIGISKKSLQRIFEPFEREHTSTQSGVFGSGLGLTIAKHIIEMMGGTIDVQSAVGKGSTFTVTLSLRVKNDNAETAESCDGQDITEYLKNKKILLVEDNEINLEIETEMLEDLGLTVDTAENGKIAVDKVRASKPDEYLFVLMDIQMPVMDGRQAAEAIRKLDDKKLSQIPIIALSANALESDKKKSAETGMDEHLPKPIDIPLLLDTLARILKKRR